MSPSPTPTIEAPVTRYVKRLVPVLPLTRVAPRTEEKPCAVCCKRAGALINMLVVVWGNSLLSLRLGLKVEESAESMWGRQALEVGLECPNCWSTTGWSSVIVSWVPTFERQLWPDVIQHFST